MESAIYCGLALLAVSFASKDLGKIILQTGKYAFVAFIAFLIAKEALMLLVNYRHGGG